MHNKSISRPRSLAISPSRSRLLTFSLLVTSLLGLNFWSACASQSQLSDVQALFRAGPRKPTPLYQLEESSKNPRAFFSSPFPSDARRNEHGAPDLQNFPNPGGIGFIAASVKAVANDADGFSTTGTIYLPFDESMGPLHVPPSNPNESVYKNSKNNENNDEGSPIFLVDVDPKSPEYGVSKPILWAVSRHHDGIRPANLLQIQPVPGLSLRPHTTYAAIVKRDLTPPTTFASLLAPATRTEAASMGAGAGTGRDTGIGGGYPDLGTSEVLQAFLVDQSPTQIKEHTPIEQKWFDSFEPLRRALPHLHLKPTEIAAATVFTTADPTARLLSFVDQMKQVPVPMLKDGSLHVDHVYADFTVLRGILRMPRFQKGNPPYFADGEGVLAVDANGMLLQQAEDEAPFTVAIPHGVMPDAGFPLYFYVHGTGGRADQPIMRGRRFEYKTPAPAGSGLASWIAPEGWATSCMAGTFSPERIGNAALDGYGAYSFFNPPAMRDNFLQMIIEQTLFIRFLENWAIDPHLVPQVSFAAIREQPSIRLQPRVVGGQSLGSYLSGMLASVWNGFDGAILTGAGGSWVEFAFGPRDPVEIQRVIEWAALPQYPRAPKLDRFHPFIMIFTMAVGDADNTNYTPSILRYPRAGYKPPHVLIVEGHDDVQVPTNLQRALVLSVGTDMAGKDVRAKYDDQIAPILPYGGQKQLPYPVTGNYVIPSGDYQGERRTAVVVRYPEDGLLEGHYVYMQRPEPQAQIVDFVRDLKNNTLPLVVDHQDASFLPVVP